MNTKNACIIIGIVFLAVGFLGFISNPIVGDSEDAIFHTDTFHNIVHIVSGALFILIAVGMPSFAKSFCLIFGFVYFLLGVLGLIKMGVGGSGKVLGILHVNGADNFLHMALGLLIFWAGTLKPRVAT